MTPPATPQLVRARLWQRVEGAALERFELLHAADAWHLRGTILAAVGAGAAEVSYEVTCDGAWRTRRADIRLRDDAGERSLAILAAAGRWTVNGRQDDSMRGCVDLDLAWSPSTNTLPIRRLGLEVGGASGPLAAAWVRFPELTVQPLEQEYRRLSESMYRYTSRGGAFAADLEVDGDGLVLDYGGVWRRAGASR